MHTTAQVLPHGLDAGHLLIPKLQNNGSLINKNAGKIKIFTMSDFQSKIGMVAKVGILIAYLIKNFSLRMTLEGICKMLLSQNFS